MSKLIALALAGMALFLSNTVFAADGGETADRVDTGGTCENLDGLLNGARAKAQMNGCEPRKLMELKRVQLQTEMDLKTTANELKEVVETRGQTESDVTRLTNEYNSQRSSNAPDGAIEAAERSLRDAQTRKSELDTQFNGLETRRGELETLQAQNKTDLEKAVQSCRAAAQEFVKWCDQKGRCESDRCIGEVTDKLKKSDVQLKEMQEAAKNAPVTAAAAKAQCDQNAPKAGATLSSEEQLKIMNANAACYDGISAKHQALAEAQKAQNNEMAESQKTCEQGKNKLESLCDKARQFTAEIGVIEETKAIAAEATQEVEKKKTTHRTEVVNYVAKVQEYRQSLDQSIAFTSSVAHSTSATGVAMDPFVGYGSNSYMTGSTLAAPPGGVTQTPLPQTAPLPPTKPAAAAATTSGTEAPSSSAGAANTGTAADSQSANNNLAGFGTTAASTAPVVMQTGTGSANGNRSPVPMTGLPSVSPMPSYTNVPYGTPTAPGPNANREAANVGAGAALTNAASNSTAAPGGDAGSDFAPAQAAGTANAAAVAGSPIGGVQMGRLGNGQTNNAAATPLGPNGTAMNSKTYSGSSSSSGGSARRYNGRPYIRRADGSLMTLEEYKDRIARGEKMPDVDLRQFLPGMNAPDRNVAGAAGVTAEDLATLGSKHENAFQMVNTRYNSLSNPLDPDLPPPSK